MKNFRLFIKKEYLKMLQAFTDDGYLYNYIVNNYSELAEDNVFRNPTNIKEIEDMFYLARDNISLDDMVVWEETNKELKNKNVSFFAVITERKSGAFFVYNNLKNKIPCLEIDKDTDLFDAIKKIEEFNNEINLEEDMEM